jgi:hypothetical protein
LAFKSKFREAENRAVDAHNGGVKAQNEALEGLNNSGGRFANTLLRIRIRIRIHIKVEKSDPHAH